MTAIYKNVDPALWALIEGFPALDVTAATLAGFRETFAGLSVMPDAATHPDVRIEEVRVPGGARDIRCLQYTLMQRPSSATLLHVHPGGFVLGSPEMSAPRNIELVRATGCTILSVDYRLAPEHPYPAALEDCHAVLVWLATRAPRIGVIGESAGGGLAASLALLARDRRSAPLACQALIYPMLVPPAHSVDAAAPDPRIGLHIWSRTSNEYAWSAYLADAVPDPGTVAGLATDLAALPPAFLAVGDLDLFVHDNLAYADRLLRAGCPVEVHVYPRAIHAFDVAADAPVSQRFTRELVGFLNRHLG